jgi:hypothetical protein
VQGFARNLKCLKSVFNPTYEILDMRKLSDTSFEARWSMNFDVVPVKKSPLGRVWQPGLRFTGTTIYGTNPETGLIERHIDTWDNLKKSDYFSPEAFADVLGQIFNFQQTPDLEGPAFKTLKCARSL